jgi:hypothetical protein
MPVARARRMIVLISDGSYGITIAIVTSSTGLPVKSVTFCPKALLLSMAEYCDIMRHLLKISVSGLPAKGKAGNQDPDIDGLDKR